MLNVGILTSWATKCGISEYSRYLVNALRKRDDINVTVYGSKNYDEYKVAEDEPYVIPTFGVLPWNKHGDHSFDIEAILEKPPDVLHVQYECVLYNQEPFYRLLEEYKGLKVITYHDNCIPPNFPYHCFDIQYSHRENVGVGGGYLLPMGIEERTPIVRTFGLGRSRKDIIEGICDKYGWKFEYSFGEDKWLSPDELYEWLRGSDLIVLYYDDAPAAGTSIAAQVALSTRRPVLVSATTWFDDLDISIKAADPIELEVKMYSILEKNWTTWDDIADIHIEDYKECLKQDYPH